MLWLVAFWLRLFSCAVVVHVTTPLQAVASAFAVSGTCLAFHLSVASVVAAVLRSIVETLRTCFVGSIVLQVAGSLVPGWLLDSPAVLFLLWFFPVAALVFRLLSFFSRLRITP